MLRTPPLAHVYIFEAETGLIKIGYTINPEQRIKKIQTSSGFKIKRQLISPRCSNYREVEKNLHKQFAEYRRQGEWFGMDFQTAVEALNQQQFETDSTPSTQLMAFQFEQKEVRTFIDAEGNPWFVAKDVCDILDIKNSSVERFSLDDDEIQKMYIPSLSNNYTVVSESGLYILIFRSNKPQAKPFRRWVTHEVLPTIRKTGKYEINRPPHPPLRRPEYQDFDRFITDCFTPDSAGLVSAANIYVAYKDWCESHQRPVYSHKLLGQYLNEMGYIPVKRAHGKFFWSGIQLKLTDASTGKPIDLEKVTELEDYLSALCRVMKSGERFPDNELLVLLKTAVNKVQFLK